MKIYYKINPKKKKKKGAASIAMECTSLTNEFPPRQEGLKV